MFSVSPLLKLAFLVCLNVLPIAADRSIELGGGIGGGVVGLIILVLDIIAIVDVLGSGRTVLGKLLWVLLILFFPIGGLIIWCLCGRKTTAVA